MPLSLRIDPWAPAYDSSLQIDDERPPTSTVDPFAETEDWRPLAPTAGERPDTVVFIDGVQRVETRVIAEEDGELVYGALVSVGVGAAVSRDHSSRVEQHRARRLLALGAGKSHEDQRVECGSATLVFECRSAPDRGYDGWRKAVDGVRREAETALGQAMVEEGHPLVIVDGRLTFQPTTRSRAVGVSKTIRTVYLERPQSDLLADLAPGTRTPVFSIAYEHPVYSWYVRLALPRPIEHQLAGIVQVETMAGIGSEEAVRLADLTTQYLPEFASECRWDPRAPQNLYPVSALEERLRHELGDHEWIRRNIEAHFHRQAALPANGARP